jgi:hypothetical protein
MPYNNEKGHSPIAALRPLILTAIYTVPKFIDWNALRRTTKLFLFEITLYFV